MTDFRRFLPNRSALWRLHHLKSRPHRHRTRDIASLEIKHADETPIACFKCGETPTTAGAEGTVRPEGTAAVPVGGSGAWLQHPGVMVDTHIQNLARNFPWSVFNYPHKRCNSNDANSKFERFTWELRATFLGNHAEAGAKRAADSDYDSATSGRDSPEGSATASSTDTAPRGSRRARPRYRLMAAPTSMRRGRARNAG